MNTNLVVGVEAYTASVSDEGEPVNAWGQPVDVNVYGVAPAGADEQLRSTLTGLKGGLDLYAPSWGFGNKSRVTVNGRSYLQVGEAEDFNFGPFGYTPGVRVNLESGEG